jgi:hypothetical protein
MMAPDLFDAPSEIGAGAIISDCGRYRYHLWRRWDSSLPVMVFVMLNPSTADASQDDPTIRRCIGFAKRDGFGAISVRNVFALRATNPRELLTVADPFGPENEDCLINSRRVSMMTRLVAAWGSKIGGKRLLGYYQRAAVACAINQSYCLGVTKDGDPRHPLYLRNDAPLVRWCSAAVGG